MNVSSEVTKSVSAIDRCTTAETNLPNRVLAYIAEHGSVTFDDIAWSFPEFRNGDHALPSIGDDHSNVVFWHGMTTAAARAMNLLQKRRAIRYTPVQPGDYTFRLNLPIAFKPQHYATLHWLPTKIEVVQ